jgi:UTP:GlnB (protein PII) uridylyltransferase
MPGDRDADANPLGARVAPAVKTSVVVENAQGARQSKLIITTTDRPGLLVDIVATLKDLSLNVVSAEIDTIGPKAYDIVYVTYQGGALNKSMIELVTNALTYHLTRRDIENKNSESY